MKVRVYDGFGAGFEVIESLVSRTLAGDLGLFLAVSLPRYVTFSLYLFAAVFKSRFLYLYPNLTAPLTTS